MQSHCIRKIVLIIPTKINILIYEKDIKRKHLIISLSFALIHKLLPSPGFLNSQFFTFSRYYLHTYNTYYTSITFQQVFSACIDYLQKKSQFHCWITNFQRLNFTGARFFFFHKSYEGTVSFVRETDGDTEKSVCLKNNCSCVHQTNRANYEADKSEKIDVITHNISYCTQYRTLSIQSRAVKIVSV